jgi:acetyl-CoA C-acetyltransferase
METRRVYLAGAVRTPIGNFGGALASASAAQLAGVAAAAAVERSGVPKDAVDELLMGHARQAGNGPNLGRQVVRRAGLPDQVPAFTIHKACASGMQAVVSAAQSIRLGDSDVALAGGVEHMSSIPYLAMDVRWGKKLGDEPLLDAMYRDGYLCPLCNQLMGETSETLASEYAIPREEQDRYAQRSNQRAARAWAEGRFAPRVVPVSVGEGKRATVVERDEHPRGDATLEELTKLRPVFKKDGSVTAGNASAITDGAAAVMVLSEAAVKAHGVKPQAALLGAVSVGLDPRAHGTRAGAGDEEAARATPARARADRRHRAERGVRLAGSGVRPRAQDGPRAAQPQRRRDRDRPPDRMQRHAHHRRAGARAGARERPLRHRHAVRERRPRDGGARRARLSATRV